MRFLCVILLIVLPTWSFADLDRAITAYNAEDYDAAQAEAVDALAGDLNAADALLARELILSSRYFAGETSHALRDAIAAADEANVAHYGQEALERLDLLFILSDLDFELSGAERASQTDALIARIASKHLDVASEDLLWAVRNLAIAYDHEDADAETSLAFAALFEFYASELRPPEDPMVQEATAMSALALLRADQGARAAQRYFRYSYDTWLEFADIGPEEDDQTYRLLSGLDTLPVADETEWFAEIERLDDAAVARDALAGEIGTLLARGELKFASPYYLEAVEKMQTYISSADPSDPVAANFLNAILRSHLSIGDYNGARPYLAGILRYPASYLAVLDLPIGALGGAFALRGGVEDALLEPLLQKALQLDALVPDDDPELRFDLTFALAQIRDRQGRTDEALSDYLAAIDLAKVDGVRPKLINQALSGAAETSIAQDDFAGAENYARQMRETALETSDNDAISAAFTLLARASSGLGQPEQALEYARQKLTFEANRTEQDPDAIQLARINLAAYLMQAEGVTPELVAVLPGTLFATAPNPHLAALQADLIGAIASQLDVTPDTIAQSQLFRAVSPKAQADLVAFLAEAAAAEGQIALALRWLIVGQDIAVAPGPALYRMTRLQGDLALVLGEDEQALTILRQLTDAQEQEFSQAQLDHLPLHMTAAARLARADQATSDNMLNEAFELAQTLGASRAGQSLTAALLRDQSGGAVQALLRQRMEIDAELDQLTSAISQANYDGRSADGLQDRAARLLAERAGIVSQIFETDPALAQVTTAQTLSISEVRAALRPDEALVLYATSDARLSDGSPTSHMVALSRDAVSVAPLPPRSDLRALADALRCSAALTDPNCGVGGEGTRGKFSLAGPAKPTGPQFDTALAHEAFQTFLGPVAEILDGKSRLIIVPDAALAALPAHLMLSEPLPAGRELRDARWLIRDHAVEIAPTVASFVALRTAPDAARRTPSFLGVGDPLIGVQTSGPVDYPCRDANTETLTLAALASPDLQRAVGPERISMVADLNALPDTRCELTRIADRFAQSRVLLHEAATEDAIKSMSEAGELNDFSIVSFATHGLIAGEIGINDSGLVLTPPRIATARDDGLLTTSEIASLRLDADFVILSACNTASGDSRSSEGLSGMASAFFAAGAKSLLVSHWPVYSDAAVDLTTRSFDALSRDPNLPRADAVRLAMLDILDDPASGPREQHPSYWGPFMVVGDGLRLSPDQ